MKPSQPTLLRASVQRFVREFGLLASDQTPCGMMIPVSEAHALMVILASDQAGVQLNVKGLVSQLHIDKSNVSRMCKRMEKSGLIHCISCDTDARLKRIKLTAKGKRLATKVDTASKKKFTAITKALSGTSSESVITALEQLTTAIRNTS